MIDKGDTSRYPDWMYMTPHTRSELLKELFPTLPSYRFKQIHEALFDRTLKSWKGVSTLPQGMREIVVERIPWLSIAPHTVLESKDGETVKTVMNVEGGARIETVLMKNRRDQWTICVSSQVGCAMRCTFCATGKMGFNRNLTSDEIVDQYRFWAEYLQARPSFPQRISNVVFMGMGEPLANYDSVKKAVNTLLEFTDLGPTHIIVSTVGMLPRLQELLKDKSWPHVRLAISLHSADATTRKEIVPTSYDKFLETLSTWAKDYLKLFGNRRHHLSFEYVMLSGVNDTDHHARALAQYVNSIGRIKVNLIPYNATGAAFTKTSKEKLDAFLKILTDKGVTATVRKTMGDDIAAACGQLITEQDKRDK